MGVLAGGGVVAFLSDAFVDLLTVNRYGPRSRDADSDLVPLHPEHRHGDFIADHDGLPYSSGENKHPYIPEYFENIARLC